jgi:threonine synthase
VTDEAILEAYREVARREGIFCEPSSAAGIAALRASVAAGLTPAATSCVCVCTGHGLKDAQQAPSAEIVTLPASPEAVAVHLERAP